MSDVRVGEGDTGFGCEWEVRKRGEGLFLVVGHLGLAFSPQASERFAEAVARATAPGQRVKHGPACQCTPCKAEPGYEARRDG